jgi:hypothetical protein
MTKTAMTRMTMKTEKRVCMAGYINLYVNINLLILISTLLTTQLNL